MLLQISLQLLGKKLLALIVMLTGFDNLPPIASSIAEVRGKQLAISMLFALLLSCFKTILEFLIGIPSTGSF